MRRTGKMPVVLRYPPNVSLATPFGDPSLGLLLRDKPARFNIRQTGGDLLAHVDVVLNV